MTHQLRDLVQLIRDKETSYLSDARLLEVDLIPKLGLNDENNVAHSRYFPDELEGSRGGLRIWQYPNQFSKYLVELPKHRIGSYLEIGVRHGGSFITTVEYLQRFQPVRAVGVDVLLCPTLHAYQELNPAVEFWQVHTRSDAFLERLLALGDLDLVFIDGDHSEQGCWNDFTAVRDRCRMVAFHDIRNIDTPGVSKVWARVKRAYAARYTFHEFTEQYASIEREGRLYMGIGLAVRRT